MVYKIRSREGYSPEIYENYEILDGTQFIGWMLVSKNKIPILYVIAEKHKLNKHALAVAVKKVDPDSWGTYFLVTEFVSFEDLKEEVPEDSESDIRRNH